MMPSSVIDDIFAAKGDRKIDTQPPLSSASLPTLKTRPTTTRKRKKRHNAAPAAEIQEDHSAAADADDSETKMTSSHPSKKMPGVTADAAHKPSPVTIHDPSAGLDL